MEISTREYLISIFFPKHCPFCGHLMEASRTYCAECGAKLPWIPDNALCPNCGKMDCICFEKPFLKRLYIPFFYRGIVADAIQSLKFYNKRGYSRPLGGLLAQYIRSKKPVSHFCLLYTSNCGLFWRNRGFAAKNYPLCGRAGQAVYRGRFAGYARNPLFLPTLVFDRICNRSITQKTCAFTSEAVSYTHLDVYKRQMQTSSSWSGSRLQAVSLKTPRLNSLLNTD